MKIEINDNKVFFNYNNKKTEIHPIWLRERANGQNYLDKKTDQRLFDPTFLENIHIKNATVNKNILELSFNDGANSKYDIEKLTSEFSDSENISNSIEQISISVSAPCGIVLELKLIDFKFNTLKLVQSM